MLVEARDRASATLSAIKTRVSELTGKQLAGAAALGAGAVAAGVVAGKAIHFMADATRHATDFQQEMLLVHTQTGASMAEVNQQSQNILQLAPKVGMSTVELAQGLYRLESVGYRSGTALKMLTADAHLAQVGHASLEDTIRSVNAIMVSHIKGIHSAKQATGLLNATVGAGDMRMGDLVGTLGNLIPVAATYGITAQDAGASLATLTDNSLGAAESATRLRMMWGMAVQAMTSSKAGNALKAIGMDPNSLAYDLRHFKDGTLRMVEDLRAHIAHAGGLASMQTSMMAQMLGADPKGRAQLEQFLRDVEDHVSTMSLAMRKKIAAGFNLSSEGPSTITTFVQQLLQQMQSGKAMLGAQVMNQIFGGARTGVAAMILSNEHTRLGTKEADMSKLATSARANQAWSDTSKTAAMRTKEFHAAIDSLKTSVGMGLLPVLTKLVTVAVQIVTPIAEWAARHQKLSAIIIASIAGFSILAAVVMAAAAAFIIFDAAGAPVILIILAVIAAVAALAVGLYFLITHFHQVVSWLKSNWPMIVSILLGPLAFAIYMMVRHWHEIEEVTKRVWNDLKGFLMTIWNSILAELEMIWRPIVAFFGNIWSNIVYGAEEAWGEIVNFFQGLGAGVLAAIGTSSTTLYNAGVGLITGMWNGIKDAFGDVVGWFAGIGSAIINAIVGAATWLYNLGGTIIGGMWDGIKDAWNTVSGWFGSLGDKIVNAVGSAARWLYQKGDGAIGGLWQGAKDAWGTVSNWFGSTGTRVGNAVGSAAQWLYSQGKGALNGLKNGGADAWGAVKDWFGGLPDTIFNAFSKGWVKAWNGAGKLAKKAGAALVDPIIRAANWLIRGLDTIHITIPGWVPGIGGKGFGIHIPQIPLLQHGGEVLQTGLAIVHQGEVYSGVGRSFGGGNTTVVVSLEGATFWGKPSQADIDALVNQIGPRLAQVILPQSGMHVRRI